MNDHDPAQEPRHLDFADRCLTQLQRALQACVPGSATASRPVPQSDSPASRPGGPGKPSLDDSQRRHSAGLMRVNHAGEVCAQALYHGQAATARLARVRQSMAEAAAEETDHLAWCETRLRQLGSRPSLLNPLWYALSFGLGAAAGKAGDAWSLGFVAETEEQVCRHLEDQLRRLPPDDEESRAIIEQMITDERRHGETAKAAGGAELPVPVRRAMTAAAAVMKGLSYRL